MGSTERRNAVARAVLRWLYEEDDNYPLVEDFLEQPSAQICDERVSNDELVRTVRWLHDRGLIDGPQVDELPYPLKLILTAAGRLVVTDQDGWVQPEAATPDRHKPSVNMIAQAFLRWLCDNDHLQPVPARFLEDPRSVVDGHKVEEAEMIEAVRLLDAKGFVGGTPSWQSGGIPVRIRLTDAGRICVVDHNADPNPRATWAQMERGGGTTVDKSVTTTGNSNTVVAHSDNVNVLADASLAPEFEVRYRRPVGRGRYEVDSKMVSGPQQLLVGIGTAVLDPQEGFAASLEGGETRRMVRDLNRTVVVTIEPPVVDREVVVEIIANCEDVEPPHERWTLHRALTITRPARVGRATVGRIPRTTM